jgi:TetR/AcrR family transcriptional regulator, transcriptional repressor for nem operon
VASNGELATAGAGAAEMGAGVAASAAVGTGVGRTGQAGQARRAGQAGQTGQAGRAGRTGQAGQAGRLTAKGERTRARIVAAAARLMHEGGVAETTIEDVKAAAGVSSSQLYHYFADKEALVQAVIGYQADTIVGTTEQAGLGTPEGLRAWRELVVTQAARSSGQGGCPLGSLGGQLAETDARARGQVAEGFGRWSEALRSGLRELDAAGRLRPGMDLDALAVTLLASLQGGLLLAQVERDPRPLETALDTFLALVLTP